MPSSADLTREEIEIASQGDASQSADSMWTVIQGESSVTRALIAALSGNNDRNTVDIARLIRCISSRFVQTRHNIRTMCV